MCAIIITGRVRAVRVRPLRHSSELEAPDFLHFLCYNYNILLQFMQIYIIAHILQLCNYMLLYYIPICAMCAMCLCAFL